MDYRDNHPASSTGSRFDAYLHCDGIFVTRESGTKLFCRCGWAVNGCKEGLMIDRHEYLDRKALSVLVDRGHDFSRKR